MELLEAIEQRHSVRQYSERAIEPEVREALKNELEACNRESRLNFQIAFDEPDAFQGGLTGYGKFTNVRNYFALIGKKCDGFDEKVGYYGERIVIKAQQLGLNTCWVAMTFNHRKNKLRPAAGEKLGCMVALGYGTSGGHAHKSKPLAEVCVMPKDAPQWFLDGISAAQMAPTAMNQQKYRFTLVGDHTVKAESTGGPYSAMDLGIAKYHFEMAAGKQNFSWA